MASSVLTELLGLSPRSGLELAELVESGLALERLSSLRARGLSAAEVGATVISARTLQHRRARGERLSVTETDRAVRVASVVEQAEQVFGSAEKAMRWLRGKDDRLGDRTPLSLLGTEAGGRLVQGLLAALDEGVFS